MFQFLLVSLLVNVAYIMMFVPIYGIEAAGHASIIAYAVYNALLIRESKAYVPICIDMTYLSKVLVLSFVVVAVAAVLRTVFGVNDLFALVVQGCLCAALYLMLSMAFGLHKQFAGLSE